MLHSSQMCCALVSVIDWSCCKLTEFPLDRTELEMCSRGTSSAFELLMRPELG